MLKSLVLTFLVMSSVAAMALRPEDVTNVQLDNRNKYVTDMSGVFTDSQRADLDARCARLRDEAGVEMAIVVVDSIDGDDEYDFAYRLFNLWHIGNSNNNSGVLWLYVTSLRAMKIETGVGVEGILTDGYLKRVLEDSVFPLMKAGRTYDAFCSGMDMVESQLTSDAAREELVMNEVDNRNSLSNIISLYFALAFILMALLAIYFYYCWNRVQGSNNQRYSQLAKPYKVIRALAFPFPLPVFFLFLIVRRNRRSLRYMPMTCPKCGHTMKVLSENEEDPFLTNVQQAEENVHTVDYDVWLCPECGTTKILDYDDYASSLYKRCPHCGGHTYRKVSEKVLFPPTPLTPGRGVKVYRCSSCGYTNRFEFTIPPVPIIVGGGGHGGGSGFSGGGFGGGFSAGGGAGGHF